MSADLAGTPLPRTYRRSALASAFVRMWRAWAVIVPVVVVNAVVQALLVWPDVTMDSGWLLVLTAVASALAFVSAFGLVASAALRVPDGRVDLPAAASGLRVRWIPYGLWALALLAAFSVGLLVNPVVALLVLALTPFLLLAALDGRGNALAVDLRTIGRRFWRWLVTCVIVGGAVVLGTLLTGVTQFFLRGGFGALVVWLVVGLVVSWFTVAWALIYRRAWALPSVDAASAPPDLEPAA